MKMKPATMLNFPQKAVAFAWHVRSSVVGPWDQLDNQTTQLAQEQVQQMVRNAAFERNATAEDDKT